MFLQVFFLDLGPQVGNISFVDHLSMTASGNILKKTHYAFLTFSKIVNAHLETGCLSEIAWYFCPSEFAFTLKIFTYLWIPFYYNQKQI